MVGFTNSLQRIITDRADVICGNSSANMPYCQYFTFPEVGAVAYGCGTTSDTTWRTISLTSLPLTVSSNSASGAATSTTPPLSSLSLTASASQTLTSLSTATGLPTESPPVTGPIQGEKEASGNEVVSSSTNAIARFDYSPKDRNRGGLWSSIHFHHNWVSLGVFKVPRLATDEHASRIYLHHQMGKRKLPPPPIEPEKSPASQESAAEGQEPAVEAGDSA